MKIDPDRIETLKAEVIVKKYFKPEKVGSLFIPEQSRPDKTGTVWEVVKSNDKADLEAGEKISKEDIVKVRWGHVTSLGVEDPEDSKGLYLIKVSDIFHRIKNTWDTPTEEK